MKNIVTGLCLILLSFSLCWNLGYAKRFGGGKSFGTQRSASFSQARSAVTQKVQQSVASRAKSWLGPMAGLLAGGLIASMLMGHGFGTGIITWLVIGLGVFLLFSFLRNRFQPAAQAASPLTPNSNFQPFEPQAAMSTPEYAPAASNSSGRLFDQAEETFNNDAFLREAKSQFIRLQAAYDQKNLNDLRQFTSPQVYAEIQLQLQERGSAANHTEVVELHANILEVTHEYDHSLASVRFSGLIRENLGQNPESFSEIWHFQKEKHEKDWMVSGLQQTLS